MMGTIPWDRILAWSARYVHVPSRSGFSAYRTGWAAHVAFSAIVATGLHQLAVRQLGISIAGGLGLALVGVCLLWPVGVFVGILSHYSLLLTVCPLLVFGGGFLWPPLLLGFAVAATGHVLVPAVSARLNRMSGSSRRDLAPTSDTRGPASRPPE
jgi:hypothetical protein